MRIGLERVEAAVDGLEFVQRPRALAHHAVGVDIGRRAFRGERQQLLTRKLPPGRRRRRPRALQFAPGRTEHRIAIGAGQARAHQMRVQAAAPRRRRRPRR